MTVRIEELERISGVRVQRNYSAKKCTTMAVGGELELLIDINSAAALARVLELLNAMQIGRSCIGAGSNVIVPDTGLKGATIRMGRGFSAISDLGDGRFRIEAGAALPTVSSELSRAGWAGLEFAAGIPGSIGGAVRMNAGAHGGEISDLIESIEVISSIGEAYHIKAAELGFSYRTCSLPANSIVTAAVIKLEAGDSAAILQRRAAMLAERKLRQPLSSPSSGSVFRNPAGDRSAGALIEGCGLKGCRVGGAEISRLHANWIINPNRTATAAEVSELHARARAEVLQRYGIELESEVIFLEN